MNKKIVVIAGLILFAIACCLLLLWNKPVSLPSNPHPSPHTVKGIRKQLNKSENYYQQQIKMLRQTAHKTESKLAATRQALNAARATNKLLIKQAATEINNPVTDSSNSLPETLNQLALNDKIKDSICDAALLVQGQLLENRDSVISIMERQYSSTAKTLDETLQVQQFTYRQMKKEKRRKVIWKLVAFTAGTLLLTCH